MYIHCIFCMLTCTGFPLFSFILYSPLRPSPLTSIASLSLSYLTNTIESLPTNGIMLSALVTTETLELRKSNSECVFPTCTQTLSEEAAGQSLGSLTELADSPSKELSIVSENGLSLERGGGRDLVCFALGKRGSLS